MVRHPVRIGLGGLLFFIFVTFFSTFQAAGKPEKSRPGESVPASFRVSPSWTAYFKSAGAFLNPKSKLLVVFFWEDGESKQRIYSRLFNSLGRPVSGFQLILEVPAKSMAGVEVAYGATDDRYFLAGPDYNSDAVKGLLLDGRGRTLSPLRGSSEENLVVIKPATKPGSARNVKTGWIPSLNRYLAAWTYHDWADRSNPKTGHYLTGLDSSLNKVFGPRQVRAQAMMRKPYSVRSLIPFGNRILWGSGEDAPDYTAGSRPVVWFTDLRGSVLKSYAPATGGFINPGGRVNDEYGVLATHNPKSGLFLLVWSVIDSIALSQAKSAETQFRLMNESGRFTSSLKILPKTMSYQYRALAACCDSENRFFLGCLEYRSLDDMSMYFWGGKISGFFVNNQGGFENRSGQPSSAPIPLVDFLMDPAAFVGFDALASGVPNACLYAGYTIAKKTEPYGRSLWGLILK